MIATVSQFRRQWILIYGFFSDWIKFDLDNDDIYCRIEYRPHTARLTPTTRVAKIATVSHFGQLT